jgi:hypothetical protein
MISTEDGVIGAPGFATEFLVNFTPKWALQVEISKQGLGTLELQGSNMVFDEYGVGVFEGTQENVYDMSYQSIGVTYTDTRKGSSSWWGGIGIGFYKLNTAVTVKEGWFRYTDIWGNYGEVDMSGYSASESLSLTGVTFGGGVSTLLDGWFRLYMKSSLHILPIGDKSEYTKSFDGTLTVVSVTVGAGIGF